MAASPKYKEECIMQTFTKVGLDALLTPENCAVLLIDHQPFQLANVNSHDPTIVINNVTASGAACESGLKGTCGATTLGDTG